MILLDYNFIIYIYILFILLNTHNLIFFKKYIIFIKVIYNNKIGLFYKKFIFLKIMFYENGLKFSKIGKLILR